MTNYEYYEKNIKDFLLEHGHSDFAIINNEIIDCNCSAVNCSKCLFYKKNETCPKFRKNWLNAEYQWYSIPADTPVDTKVLVSNDGEEWFKRYFSHFFKNDPKPYACFESGSSSWNASGVYHWRYCKLWEEDTTNVNE